MEWTPASALRWLLDSERGPADRLNPRWIFLRALGLIYFSAFFSLVFQIRGLIGPGGILPVGDYLPRITDAFGNGRFWFTPTLLWFSAGSPMLMAICWAGMLASLLVVLNVWPKGALAICFICFISFVSAARDFSGYQSDSMLLEAGFLALFFAPAGFRPRWGESRPPSRISYFLLLWLWFRIYFESGVAKIVSGDLQWRHLTAIYDYFQNGPLPTWIGWYAANLPHWFLKGTAAVTLGIELGLVWIMFLPRRFRIILFWIVTPWEIGIILTANYTFLNYIVLSLGFLLLDDKYLIRLFPQSWKNFLPSGVKSSAPEKPAADTWWSLLREQLTPLKLSLIAVILGLIFYATAARMIWMVFPAAPLPITPVRALAPWRIADQYGLFAIMTPDRYELEFQGSNDGVNWTAYKFRFKPQDIDKAPRIYAPYQPRFDWNLWFASLGSWREFSIVPRTETLLLKNDQDVISLFADNPFPNVPPKMVRVVVWQYWFSTPAEKHAQGVWWRRQLLGLYAPAIELETDGKIGVLQWPAALPPQQ
jgi:hypothetical protein